MKRIVIQYNFFSGLGDMYCGMTEASNFAARARSLGYEVSLVFCNHSGSGPLNKYISDIKVEEIFDKKWLDSAFDYYETRERSTHNDELLGCFFLARERFTPIQRKMMGILPEHHQWDIGSLKKQSTHNHELLTPIERKMLGIFPGHHQWDIFFNEFPYSETPEYELYVPESYTTSRIIFRNPPITPFPSVLPIFIDEVYNRRDKFLSNKPEIFNYLQLRYHDLGSGRESKNDPSFLKVCIETRKSLMLSKRNFLLGSNEIDWINYQSDLKNTFTYTYKDLNLFTNNHNYYLSVRNEPIPRDKLYERLLDNIAEMVSLEKAQDFFSCTVFGWVSSFMFYALVRKRINKIPFTFYKLNLESMESFQCLYKDVTGGELIN